MKSHAVAQWIVLADWNVAVDCCHFSAETRQDLRGIAGDAHVRPRVGGESRTVLLPIVQIEIRGWRFEGIPKMCAGNDADDLVRLIIDGDHTADDVCATQC